MSITVQTIITRALSKLGIVGSGQAPTTNDNALCLDALIALLNKQVTSGTLGDLVDVIPAHTPYTPGEGERVVNDGTITVTLPTLLPTTYCYSDYGIAAFVNINTQMRPPRDLAVIEEVRTDNGTRKTNIYSNRTRNWMDINSITYSSVCPLAERDANGLACLLAMNVADEFGQQPTQLVAKAAYDFQLGLAENWSQSGQLVEPRKHY